MKHEKKKVIKAPVYQQKGVIAVCILLTLICIMYFQSFRRSLFVSPKERVNVVFYGKEIVMYSLDTSGDIHYSLYYPPDVKMKVPGGYGTYRVGALGKLVSLETDARIFQKTFSSSGAFFVDYYFYIPNSEVYYGSENPDDFPFPSTWDFFNLSSNATVFDRIYFAILFANENKRNFKRLYAEDSDSFLKKYRGFFYSIQYRNEKKNIQIQYNDRYSSAENISTILEGSGIRVSDLTETDEKVKKCEVWEHTKPFSATAGTIAQFFGCSLKHRDTSVYDIIFILGEREEEWEVR